MPGIAGARRIGPHLHHRRRPGESGDPASDFALETRPNGGRINLGACGNTAEASRSAGSGRLFGDGFES